jgi:hypothetical protein
LAIPGQSHGCFALAIRVEDIVFRCFVFGCALSGGFIRIGRSA